MFTLFTDFYRTNNTLDNVLNIVNEEIIASTVQEPPQTRIKLSDLFNTKPVQQIKLYKCEYCLKLYRNEHNLKMHLPICPCRK